MAAVAIAALAGCSGQSALEEASMEAQLAAAESRLATAVASKPADLEPATAGLIRVVAEWRDELGDDEAHAVLQDAATTVAATCAPCGDDFRAADEDASG